jgi:hypothetical protein
VVYTRWVIMALLALRDPSPFVGIPPGIPINTGKGSVIRMIWAFISSVLRHLSASHGHAWSYLGMSMNGACEQEMNMFTRICFYFSTLLDHCILGAYSIPQVLDKSHLSPPIPIELGAMYSIFPSRGWTSLGISGTSLKHGTWCVRSEFPKSGRWIKQNKISLG